METELSTQKQVLIVNKKWGTKEKLERKKKRKMQSSARNCECKKEEIFSMKTRWRQCNEEVVIEFSLGSWELLKQGVGHCEKTKFQGCETTKKIQGSEAKHIKISKV